MKRILAAAAAALLALPILAASAAIPKPHPLGTPPDYIRGHFQLDGAYGTGAAGQNFFDAIIAVRAAGYDPAKDHTDTNVSPVTWLHANVAAQTSAPSAAKAALAAAALGQNPKAINGVDLIGRISGGLNPVTGLYAADDFSQSIAMLGLACTGNTVPLSASTALKATQLKDGGWGFGGASDPDTTAIAVQALLAAGAAKDDPAVAKAVTFFKTTQLPDGGWGFAPDSNAASTAFVVQALSPPGKASTSRTTSRPGVARELPPLPATGRRLVPRLRCCIRHLPGAARARRADVLQCTLHAYHARQRQWPTRQPSHHDTHPRNASRHTRPYGRRSLPRHRTRGQGQRTPAAACRSCRSARWRWRLPRRRA